MAKKKTQKPQPSNGESRRYRGSENVPQVNPPVSNGQPIAQNPPYQQGMMGSC